MIKAEKWFTSGHLMMTITKIKIIVFCIIQNIYTDAVCNGNGNDVGALQSIQCIFCDKYQVWQIWWVGITNGNDVGWLVLNYVGAAEYPVHLL